LLHFIRMKIKKKWISIRMKWVQRGLFNRDEYLGYFFENDAAAIREDFDFFDRQKIKPIRKVSMC
jgi:hypothetical protein